jgi:hypothetical protein
LKELLLLVVGVPPADEITGDLEKPCKKKVENFKR